MKNEKMALPLLGTGVPGLDAVLGGGLPEYSFNLIAGAPGSGKTTLIHQLLFANVSEQKRAVYFTVLGEPSLKMLRYQQQLDFFDAEKVGSEISFIDLSEEVVEGNFELLLERIVETVQSIKPAFVVVDSFRTIVRTKGAIHGGNNVEAELQAFLQRLALHLASWQVTSFLIGEYTEQEMHNNPVFTIADGIMVLAQAKERNSIIRKLQVLKMRGLASVLGVHSFRLGSAGVHVFPRTNWRTADSKRMLEQRRVSIGVPSLDEMIGGGLPVGDATLVAGPSGTGKTVLAMHFAAAGEAAKEPVVLAVFEEHVEDYLARAAVMGFEFQRMIDNGTMRVVSLQPLDLSPDEILHEMHSGVKALGAKRLVIDSLNGLELALSPGSREDFRESLYRMVGSLTGGGVSVLMTMEVPESFTEISFSPNAVSFLSQNTIFYRYVEVAGQLRKVIVVIKMRRSEHSTEMREYEISSKGIRVLGALSQFQGLLTGIATLRAAPERSLTPGLSLTEQGLLDRLISLNEATQEQLRTPGMSGDQLTAALTRLVDLNYVSRIPDGDRILLRPLIRPLGTRG